MSSLIKPFPSDLTSSFCLYFFEAAIRIEVENISHRLEVQVAGKENKTDRITHRLGSSESQRESESKRDSPAKYEFIFMSRCSDVRVRETTEVSIFQALFFFLSFLKAPAESVI